VSKRITIDGSKEITDWIPCSERMPELNQEVLIFDKNWEVIEFAKLEKNTNEQQGWSNGREDLLELEAVTHWQPLPKKPEAK